MDLFLFTLQQDNATPHIARVTQKFFEEHNLGVLVFPANSPDMNPIEHLRDILGHSERLE